MKLNTVKKISFILLNIIMYSFLLLCVLILCYSLLSANGSDEAVSVFGHQVRVVETESMEKCDATDVSGFEIGSIPVNSAVLIERIPSDPEKAAEWYKGLKVGDVLTFKYTYTRQITVTHRITSIKENGRGGYLIALAGDNTSSSTDQLYQVIDTSESNSGNYVIGKVVGQSKILGAVISFIQKPVGTVCVIIVPCILIIFAESMKLVKAASEKKRLQAQKESEKKDEELELLRKRVAELEGSDSAGEDETEKKN